MNEALKEEYAEAKDEQLNDSCKFFRPPPVSETTLKKLSREGYFDLDEFYFVAPNSNTRTQIYACLSFQNEEPVQENAVGCFWGEDELAFVDPADGAVLLENTLIKLRALMHSENNNHLLELGGTTLTLTLAFPSETEVNVVAANIGRCRALLMEPNAVHRLTCEHTLDRSRECQLLLSRQFIVRVITVPKEEVPPMVATDKFTQPGKIVYHTPRQYEENAVVREYNGAIFLMDGKTVDTSYALQMTRMLGAHRFARSPFFSSQASYSSHAITKASRGYVFVLSDGVTSCVTDENILEVFKKEKLAKYSDHLILLAALARLRGSKRNLSIGMLSLHNLMKLRGGKVFAVQFVANGFGRKKAEELVATHIESFFREAYEERKKYKALKASLIPCEIRSYQENILDKVDMGLMSYAEGINRLLNKQDTNAACREILSGERYTVFALLDFVAENREKAHQGVITFREALDNIYDGMLAHFKNPQALLNFLKPYRERTKNITSVEPDFYRISEHLYRKSLAPKSVSQEPVNKKRR